MIDESQPLLAAVDEHARAHTNEPVIYDPRKPELIVDFDPNGDPENPKEWSNAFKWGITTLLAFMAFTVTFNCISPVPVATRIVADLSSGGEPSKYASVLLVTIWELGEAAGPLIIAPLSEIFGRYPVMRVSNTLFVMATIIAALSQTTPMFIFARALSGLTVSTNVLNPAIIGDMFETDQNGSPMSLINLAPLIGGAVGPAISGAIAQSLNWRWGLWVAAILAGTGTTLFFFIFHETYKVPILKSRAEALKRTWSGSTISTINNNSKNDVNQRKEIAESIARPFLVFGSSGVLMAISLFGSVAFAHFYNVSTTLPNILEEAYGLPPALTGASMIFFTIGSVVSVFFCNCYLDQIYVRLRASNNGIGEPEFRLPLVILGGLTMPLAVAFYGWSAELRLPLPVILLSVCMIGVTMMLSFVPLSPYVVESFGLYSASAMTGLIVTRCLMGTFLPLATTPLVEKFGYGWGFTILAFVSFALAPIPAIVMRYGHRWRQFSKYSRVE